MASFKRRLHTLEESLAKVNDKLVTTETKKASIQEDILSLSRKVEEGELTKKLNMQVLQLLRTVSSSAKENVIKYLEKIVTSALCFIYGHGHKFIMELDDKDGKAVKAKLNYYIYDGNIKVKLKKPFVGKGGGKVTLVAVALQLAIVEYMDIDGVLLLDEITKHADVEAVENMAAFLKEYSLANDRQIVNITHHEAVKNAAGTLLSVTKDSSGIANVNSEIR